MSVQLLRAAQSCSEFSPLMSVSSVLICTSLFPVLHCAKPAGIAHGSLSSPAKAFFTPGTSVSYICEPGFSLSGTASIYCMQSGAWSHPPPICQGVFLLQKAKKKGQVTQLALGKGLCQDYLIPNKCVIRARSSLYPLPKSDGVTGLQNQLLILREASEREQPRLPSPGTVP